MEGQMRRFRRLVASLAAAAALSGCGSDVLTQGATTGGVVATYHAPGVSFGSYSTFAIVDKVGLVTDSAPGPTYVSAPGLLGHITSDLEARGFLKVADVDPTSPPATPPAADLAINVTALEATQQTFGSWAGYGGYWGPAGWGYPSDVWGYSWTWVPITYKTGTLLVEMGDLRNESNGQIGVVWTALGYAVSSGNQVYDTSLAYKAVDQAFAQSPYLYGAGATP
jgi:hypothetical protein